MIVMFDMYRFYTALYKKLLDPHLLSSTHHATFLNLLYKAVNSDTEVSRVQAFVKRILQVNNITPFLVLIFLYLLSPWH
jgi:ribosome biogenesis protein MAK21